MRVLRPCLFLLLLLLGACIAVPRTEVVYDPDCRIQFRQMRLDMQSGDPGVSCRGQDCLAWLALVGAISAASVVISGSIVIVGNSIYWLEKQGRCLTGPPLPPPEREAPAAL